MPVLLIVGFIGFVIAMLIFGAHQAKVRRENMAALAAKLGLHFMADKDHQVDDRYQFLDALRKGSNRYAINTLFGPYREHQVRAFDYHYETHSTDSKGNRQTHHHYLSFFILELPRAFPELRIGSEGIFSKLAQALGHDDIDFESAEFSRTFCVRSRDKKFAYDFCNARMIEYLLANRDLSVEVENTALAISFARRLDAPGFERNLNRLITLREKMPNYLFDER